MKTKLSDQYSQAKKSSDSFRTPPDLFEAIDSVTPCFWDAACIKNNCLVPEQKLAVDSWDSYDYLKSNMNLMLSTIRMHCHKTNHPLDCKYHDRENLSVFINPPYSRGQVAKFIAKAWEDAKLFRVVMLLKADMSTNWFNILIDYPGQQPTHRNQFKEWGLKRDYETLLRTMKEDTSRVGILHLRKRVKFLADEEMMEAERDRRDFKAIISGESIGRGDDGWPIFELQETKNFKRSASDGGLIYPKSTGTFPSMVVVLDRRGEK